MTINNNKELWKNARLNLCSTFLRIVKKKHHLASLSITTEDCIKKIDITDDQLTRFIHIIQKETEVAL